MLIIIIGCKQQPIVKDINPDRGPISGNTFVTITGANFKSGATVTIDGIPLNNIEISSDESTITGNTPKGTSGIVIVSVVNPKTRKSDPASTIPFIYKEDLIKHEEDLIKYKITRRGDTSMNVSIPHSSTEAQIRQLNSKLMQEYFASTPIVAILYDCLTHPTLKPYIKKKVKKYEKYIYRFDDKELIATYNYNEYTMLSELYMVSPTPGERYPDIMTNEEIKRLNDSK
jgi:hypothetical protein